MLVGIILSFPVSFLSFLCSPLFNKLTKGSGLLKRALSHVLFLPIYIFAYLIVLPVVGVNFESSNIGLANGCLFYLLLITIYEGILGKIDRSVSLKVLMELDNALDKKMNLETLETILCVETMISKRLDSLSQHGYVVLEDKYYKTTLKGLMGAKLLVALRFVFSGKYDLIESL